MRRAAAGRVKAAVRMSSMLKVHHPPAGHNATPLDRLRNSFDRDELPLAKAICLKHIAFENVLAMLSPN